MTKTIYVPQGYSARLVRATHGYGISGLYTDGFSSCNIVAGIGTNKLVLIHADLLTLTKPGRVQQELAWIDDPKEIIIMYRTNSTCAGEKIKQMLMDDFQSIMPDAKITEKIIEDTCSGIYLSFVAQKSSRIHPNIREFFGYAKPKELIRHPQEQKFLAVQKIEQIVGQNEKKLTQLSAEKKFYIFDGVAWEPLGECELKVCSEHAITRKEMEMFLKQDTNMELCRKLVRIVETFDGHIVGGAANLGISVANYLEGYLNNYDYALLFKRNLQQVIDCQIYTQISEADKKFKTAVNVVLDKENDVFVEIQELMEQFTLTAPATEFKGEMIVAYKMFVRHYEERKGYHDLKQLYDQMRQEAMEYRGSGIQKYLSQDYSAAMTLFAKAINLYTYCCLKSEPDLATAYYNYGRSLYQMKRYAESEFFLRHSLILRSEYTVPINDLATEKSRKAWKECEDKLCEQSSTASKTPAAVTYGFNTVANVTNKTAETFLSGKSGLKSGFLR